MIVLKIIVLMFEFLGFGLILRRFSGLPLGVAPPVITSLIILILYFSNFFVSLKPISTIIHMVGILAFLVFSVLYIKGKRQIYLKNQISNLFPLYFFCGLGIVLSFYFLNKGGEFHSWDEFSHWGTVIRAIYEANTFILDPNPLYCQDYPPGTALYSYHILSFLGYSEGNAYFSFSLLLLSYAAPIVISGLNKGKGIGLLVFGVIFFLVFALGNGWANVLIDHVLSLALAGSLISYFILQTNNRSLIFVPIMLSALVLLKHVGSTLALFAAIICSIDWLILHFTTNKDIKPLFKLKSICYKDILWLLSLFILPLLTSLSWKYFVSFNGISQGWIKMSITNFFTHSLTCCSSSREISVAGNFFKTFFDLDKPYSQQASLLMFVKDSLSRVNIFTLLFNSSNFTVGKIIIVLSIIGTGSSFLFCSAQKKLRYFILNIELTFGAILYSYSLLLAYLYGFSDYEANILISFTRYHNTFLLAWSLIFIYIMIELFEDLTTNKKRQLLLILLSALAIWSLYPATRSVMSYLIKGPIHASKERLEVKTFIGKIKSHIPEKSKVYISWYGSNGWEFWMAKYELLPKITNFDCFSLGPKLNSSDVWTCEFKTNLFEKFDYLVIGKGLRMLHNDHESIFKDVPLNVDHGLLKIDHGKHGLKFIYIPE